jgi:hypothetical protein
VEFGGGWCETAAKVLDAIAEGDVVLLQADSVEQTMPWLREQYGSRLRETSVHEAVTGPAAEPVAADRATQPAAPGSLQSGAPVKGPTHP